MADNINVTPGTGAIIAAEDVGGGVLVQRIKVVLGNTDVDDGNISATNPLPVTGSIVVTPTTDSSPSPINITAADTASTTTTGANNQPFVAGTPTANSAASFSLNTIESIEVQATGTWTGTLVSEASLDGGTTWLSKSLKQPGINYIDSSFTGNFAGSLNVTGMTNFRIRSTAAWTGTATIKLVKSQNTSSVFVANPVLLRDGTNQERTASVSAAGAVKVDGSAVTQPVSGTITANIGTAGALALDATLTGGTQKTKIVDSGGTNVATVSAGGAVKVDGSAVTQPVSGTVTANAGTNLNTSALALETGGNLASIKTNTDNLSTGQGTTTTGQKGPLVQGAVTTTAPAYTSGQTSPVSLTTTGAVRTDSSATTQPVSGTVTANVGTTNGLALDATLTGGTQKTKIVDTGGTNVATVSAAGAVKVDGSAVTQPVSGTITANAGTNLNTSALALETGGNLASIKTNTDNLNLAQATTTSGQKGNLVMGATTTAAPTYTTAQTNPISLTTAGAVRTDSSATTQPVSGTVTAVGAAASGATKSGNPVQIGAVFNTTQPTVTTGQVVEAQATARGARIVATGVDAFNVNNVTGTVSLPTGAATSANQTTEISVLNTIATNTGTAATDFVQTGTITALNGTVAVSAQGAYTVTANITGTWVGTLVFEGQLGDGAWVALPTNILSSTLPWVTVGSTTVNGTYVTTGGGVQNVRVRASAFTSGTVNVGLEGSLSQMTVLANILGQKVNSLAASAVYLEATEKQTYSATIVGLTVAANATDFFTITGSATKTIRINRIGFSGIQTTASDEDIVIVKRSTANTGGTSTTPTAVAMDSNNAAATATVRAYTANPTLGTLVGNVRANKVTVRTSGSGTSAVATAPYEWHLGDQRGQSIVLRGTAQVAGLNLNAGSIAGSSCDVYVEWTEE